MLRVGEPETAVETVSQHLTTWLQDSLELFLHLWGPPGTGKSFSVRLCGRALKPLACCLLESAVVAFESTRH